MVCEDDLDYLRLDLERLEYHRKEAEKHMKNVIMGRRNILIKIRDLLASEQRVLTITVKTNHAYKDTFKKDDDGNLYFLYKGQMKATTYDSAIMDPKLPKELLISKPSKKYINDLPQYLQDAAAECNNDCAYLYAGKVTKVELSRTRRVRKCPVFKLYLDRSSKTTSILPIEPKIEELCNANKHRMKMKALMDNGFISEDDKVCNGPVMCRYLEI